MSSLRKREAIRLLAEAQARIGELERAKAEWEKTLGALGVQQSELAAEIAGSVWGGTQIGQKTRAMLLRMARFDDAFRQATDDLGHIDARIGELSQGIQTTDDAVAQTSAAVEEISAAMTRISELCVGNDQEIQALAALTKAGQKEMTGTLGAITEVTGSIDDLHAFLAIIDDIAGRSAILAMNAAIQAAHAGTVGKGFAVVADEIRKLAESSAGNASGIARKLNAMIEAIHRAEASSAATAALLAEAEQKAVKVTGGFQEIRWGTGELAKGGEQMLAGVTSLREGARSGAETGGAIAANSRAVTGGIAELRTQAEALESELRGIQGEAASLNQAGAALIHGTTQQLRTSGASSTDGLLERPFAALLTLQHLAWVTRVRGVLDDKDRVASSTLSDHHHCDFGLWLDGPGKATVADPARYRALYADHEALHASARRVLALHESGRGEGAEEEFRQLVALSESLVPAIAALAEATAPGPEFGIDPIPAAPDSVRIPLR